MKRADVFDRQYPTPFDKSVYPLFNDYVDYERNILEGFKSQLEKDSDFLSQITLEKIRPNLLLDHNNKIHFIVTFKNTLSEEQENTLRKYIHFFKTYRSYVEYIQLILHDIYLLKENAESHGVHSRNVSQHLREQLCIYLAITRFLILSFEQNKLTYPHLHYFAEKCSQEFDDEDVIYIDKIIINYEMQNFFGGDIDAQNHFYHGVSQHHLNSWHKYFNKIRHR